MTATHSRPALLSALLSLTLGLLCLTAGASPAPEVLRAVHTDVLHTTYDGSALKLGTRVGTGTYREVDPAGLIFNLEDAASARVELPDVPAFAFLGTPGSTVWMAPESQDPELIWPGWDTETIPAGALRDDSVDLTLVSAVGPGAVEVFANYDEFTGVVPRIFSSVDPAYKTLHQPVGRHVHANWSFAALGTYQLTFQATAVTAAGAEVSSGPVTYTWVVGPYEVATPTPCVTTVLSVGHVDVAARTVGDRLRFQVKDGTSGTPVWRDPGAVAFQVRPEGDEIVPADPQYRFLGAPGATIWQIPQTQAENLLWVGWNTESVDYSKLSGPVHWSLDQVEGPGKLAVFQFDQFGAPLIAFDSDKKLPQSIALAAPTHAHGNWAFTKQGLYRLKFTYSATTKAGQHLTDTATLPVVVGNDLTPLCPTPPTTPPTSPPTTPPSTPPASPPTSSPSSPPTTPPSTPPTTAPPPGRPTTPRPTTPAPTTPPPGHPGTPTSPPTSPAEHSGTAPTTPPGSSTPKPCITTPVPTTQPSTTSPSQSAPTTAPPSATPPATASTTLSNGHADYAVRLVAGALQARIKDGTQPGTPVWRDPAAVTIRLTSAAGTTSPGGAFGFLGPKGTPVWQIPQTQKPGVIWLGWNTEELKPGQIPGNAVTWRLDKVTGPGRVSVFEFNSFGQPQVIFSSADGLPDTYQIPIGTHAHGNWSFTKPGTYNLTFTHSTPTSHTTSTLRVVVAPTGGARSLNLEHPSTTRAHTKWSTGAQGAAERSMGAQSAAANTDASSPGLEHGSTTPSAEPWLMGAQSGGKRLMGAQGVGEVVRAAGDGSGCRLAATGADVPVGWFVAAGLFILLGTTLLVVSKRGTK
ncbi:choice-of-anchor M domain-containing protein [Kribbella sp. NPDC005582]|uniref:choice-of-anchor M domain-containing protein n=1 Tax=Kribbella sp. NPDC005582 TaxID=3156893 RepID=UPI0033A5004A